MTTNTQGRKPRPPRPPVDPPLLPDPPAPTGDSFLWRPRLKSPTIKGGTAYVEYAKIPYFREFTLAGSPLGDTFPGWLDDDRDGYLRTQAHVEDKMGNVIARAVFAGGYGTLADSIMLDDRFSDHTLHWYDCTPYDGEGTEGNDIPIRAALGTQPGTHQKLQFRLVHRPTGTVVELRDYGKLFTDPNLVVNLMAPVPTPFTDQGRAVDDNGNPMSSPHQVYSRQKMVIWYKDDSGKPLESHAAYYDSLHPDWYYKVTVTGTTTVTFAEEQVNEDAEVTAPDVEENPKKK